MHTGRLTLAPAKSAIKGTALVHADFIVTGVVMTMLGPMLPMFSARWLLNDAQAGYLFVAQFATSMLGMLLSGFLVERLGYRRTLRIGLVLMAAGMAMLVRANWTLGLVAVSVYGVGFGSNTPAGNLFIADANPANRAAALNLLNSSWGIGAMGCPLLVAWAQRSQHVPLFFDGTAATLLALAAWLSWVQFSADQKPAGHERPAGASAGPQSHRLVFFVAVLFFVYVGTENSLGRLGGILRPPLGSGIARILGDHALFFLGRAAPRTHIGSAVFAASAGDDGSQRRPGFGIAWSCRAAGGAIDEPGGGRCEPRGIGAGVGFSHQHFHVVALVRRGGDASERGHFRRGQPGGRGIAVAGGRVVYPLWQFARRVLRPSFRSYQHAGGVCGEWQAGAASP